jgi:two-component system, response regulator
MRTDPLLILLVEDDPAHAEITRRNLADGPFPNEIHHVNDGQEALDYLFRLGRYLEPSASPRPHIILLDLRLPKVGGIEVLRQIKADPQLKSIPVIVLTTSAAQPDILDAYDSQASSYLVKPVELERFRRLLDTFGVYWLGLNRYPG